MLKTKMQPIDEGFDDVIQDDLQASNLFQRRGSVALASTQNHVLAGLASSVPVAPVHLERRANHCERRSAWNAKLLRINAKSCRKLFLASYCASHGRVERKVARI